MSAFDGLRNIILTSSALHSIEAPPQREDYATDAEYQAAHSAWWVRVHCFEIKTL